MPDELGRRRIVTMPPGPASPPPDRGLHLREPPRQTISEPTELRAMVVS
jgi:hypothetical protein